MAQRLTDAGIKRLRAPRVGNKITYDSDVAGLGIRVTAAGARSFVFNYRTRSGRERRHTIGSHPDWRTTGAREEARRLRRLVDEGGDPLADIEAERDAPTVAQLCDRFELEHLPRKRPGTAADYRQRNGVRRGTCLPSMPPSNWRTLIQSRRPSGPYGQCLI